MFFCCLVYILPFCRFNDNLVWFQIIQFISLYSFFECLIIVFKKLRCISNAFVKNLIFIPLYLALLRYWRFFNVVHRHHSSIFKVELHNVRGFIIHFLQIYNWKIRFKSLLTIIHAVLSMRHIVFINDLFITTFTCTLDFLVINLP
jgi:hypothetical protein